MKKYAVPSLLLMIVLIAFPQISETIYTPSLPDIAAALGVSNSSVQFTLSIYFIGFALGVFCWGWLSDLIGRRPAMLGGLIVY
ncbi:MFS transporter, partial [Paenibacillus tundrae]